MGRVRELFDQIEEAIKAGWSVETVVRALKEQQLEIAVPTLWNAMSRIRKERRNIASPDRSRSEIAPKKELFKAKESAADNNKAGAVQKSTLRLSEDGFRDPDPIFNSDPTKRKPFRE